MNSEYKVCGFRPMNGGAAVAFSRTDGNETVAIFVADGSSPECISEDIARGLEGLDKWAADNRRVACAVIHD